MPKKRLTFIWTDRKLKPNLFITPFQLRAKVKPQVKHQNEQEGDQEKSDRVGQGDDQEKIDRAGQEDAQPFAP